MSEENRYLWDGGGQPDPMVERLESLLAPLRHDGRPLPRRPRPWAAWAVSAAVAVVALMFVWDRLWQPDGLEFVIREGDVVVARLEPGELYTAEQERVLELEDRCVITAAAGSRIRVDRLDAETTRLYLDVGSLEVLVHSDMPPRFFQIETPATRCVDLGCHYVLSVDAAGETSVMVRIGRVAFEDGGRSMLVPAGASCSAAPGEGAALPYFRASTPPAVIEKLRQLARVDQPPARQSLGQLILGALTVNAQARDSLIVWHLLQDRSPALVAAASAWLRRHHGPPAGLAATVAPGLRRQLWQEHLERHWRQ